MNTAVLPSVVHDFNLILFFVLFLFVSCENQMMNEDMVEKKKTLQNGLSEMMICKIRYILVQRFI